MTASALPASAAHTPSEVLRRARSDPAYAAFLVLRIGFTVLPIVFGLDKFTNVLTKWEVYLAPWIVDMSPISAHQVMLVVGVIEIVAGVAVAIKPRYAAYIVAAWLAGIIFNLLSYPGFYDVALRDVGLLLAALTLGGLASVYDPAWHRRTTSGTDYPCRVADPTVLPSVHPARTTPATGERRDPLVSRKEPAMHSSAALQLVHPSPDRDLAAAEVAAAAFLRALGISLDSESLAGTPARMARGYAELFTPRTFDLTTFPNDEGYDELVISRNLPLRSVCEHHMLPFVGIAHIGYLPGERIIGLSKLARVAEHFACRPQRQERLTKQIADWLDAQLQPRGVGVVIEAEHSCMTLRGVQAAGSATITSTLLGALREDPRSRQEFFALTGANT